MCLAKAYAYSAKPGSENELLMESVVRVDVEDGRVQLTSLFGETKELQAHIRSISFGESKVLLESAR